MKAALYKPAHGGRSNKDISLWVGAPVFWMVDGVVFTGTVESWNEKTASVPNPKPYKP